MHKIFTTRNVFKYIVKTYLLKKILLRKLIVSNLEQLAI